MRRLLVIAWFAGFGIVAASQPPAPTCTAATRVSSTEPDTVKFAVIGDNGTGETAQYDVGRQMAAVRSRFPFDFVIMLGDNLYGRQQPQDFVVKFERPYAGLLGCGVSFYATLGNHDQPSNRFYPGFNMNGERYYTFVKKQARFFVLDTNVLDPPQLAWIREALERAEEPWKIVYFHHPLYSDAGRHGSDVELRVRLEPMLVANGVNAVFSGHDHAYERIKPQKGVTYFVEGSSGQLRSGDIVPSPLTAAYFDRDQTFMVVDIAAEAMTFETISRAGETVDSGIIRRRTTS
jgi:3',5'-cyclic AMP phosphodiesterase CpdA